jgi:hypothetical protein
MTTFILDLFDYGKNKNAQIFRNLLQKIEKKLFESEFFLKHL